MSWADFLISGLPLDGDGDEWVMRNVALADDTLLEKSVDQTCVRSCCIP